MRYNLNSMGIKVLSPPYSFFISAAQAIILKYKHSGVVPFLKTLSDCIVQRVSAELLGVVSRVLSDS